MAAHRPKTRLQTQSEHLSLPQLPDSCLSHILALAAEGVPWKERCRLGEVCRAFRTLFAAQAFASGPLCINLNTLSWRLMERKRRAAARAQLLAAVSTYAPSVRHLALRYQLDRTTGLTLAALLAPLAPHVRKLQVEDGLCSTLLEALGSGAWTSLQSVALTGCNLWIDLEPGELATLENQLAALPDVTSKITKFECSCQGMQEGGEFFFRHLTALHSLELEDWAAWDLPRDYAPLRAMPHLTRLVLNIVEDLQANFENIRGLTQVSELTLLGCYRAARGLAQLTNLTMLDLQPVEEEADGDEAAPAAAAAWKASSLTELRWCGDLVFDGGEAPIRLPRLLALEIDEAYFPPSGLPTELCTSLTQLTSLRLVGGRPVRLPPAISSLRQLQVLAIDSCQMPVVPPAVSALTAVTNLMLSNTGLGPTLPAWVIHLPVRKLWVANNRLQGLLPDRGPGKAVAFAARKQAWLGRLTHVCLSSNALQEVPPALLEHGTSLQELDMAYNHQLQVNAKTAALLQRLPSLRLLRLEKSYWLRLEDRWSRASRQAIAGLAKNRPDMQIDYQHLAGGLRMTW